MYYLDGDWRLPLRGHALIAQETMMNRLALAATMSLLLLGACGTSTQDRAMSGGAMGAAAGGVAGLLLDHPVAGVLVGGAAGAAAGALTDEDQIDLGKPIWK